MLLKEQQGTSVVRTNTETQKRERKRGVDLTGKGVYRFTVSRSELSPETSLQWNSLYGRNWLNRFYPGGVRQ